MTIVATVVWWWEGRTCPVKVPSREKRRWKGMQPDVMLSFLARDFLVVDDDGGSGVATARV